MKVALINTPFSDLYGPIKIAAGKYFPLGIGYIAAYLRNEGHEILFIDLEIEGHTQESLKAKFKKENPGIVGITCATPTFMRAVDIAKAAKEAGAVTIIGGVHASALAPEIAQRFDCFDAVCVGEGELTLSEFTKAVENKVDKDKWSAIDGLVFKNNGQVITTKPRAMISDVDKLPYPARDLVDLNMYKPHPYVDKAKKSTTILTSRGCPNSCIFCASHLTLGKKYRAHSADYVIGEMKHLIEKYNIEHFVINDDTFTIDKKRVRMICEYLIEMRKTRKIQWYCFMRVDDVSEDLLKLMKDAGCNAIGYGVESADPQILKNLKKHTSPELCREAFRLCNKFHIKTLAFFIFGTPGETPETIKKTIRFSKELKPTLAFFNMLVPYPGTEIFNMKFKDLNIFENLESFVAIGPKAVVAAEGFTKETLEKNVMNANLRFYANPMQIFRIISHIRSAAEFKVHMNAFLGWGLQLLSWGNKG